MSKKKTDKRLEHLFHDITPEESVPTKQSRKPSERQSEALTPVLAPVSIRTLSDARPEPGLPRLEEQIPPSAASTVSNKSSAMSLAFRTDEKNWATLRVVDDTEPRAWAMEEQMLVKQVADQLSLALENARLFQETQQALSETESLYQANAELNAAQSFDDIFSILRKHTVLKRASIGRLLRFDRPWNEQQKPETMHLIADWPTDKSKPGQRAELLRVKDFPAVNFLTPNEPTVTEDTSADERLDPNSRALIVGQFRAKGAIFAPITLGKDWMGFLVAYYLEATRFSKDELQHLMSLVRQASIAIEKNRLFEEAQRRAREMSALAEIGRDVSASLDLQTVLAKIAAHAKELLNSNSSAVYVPDPDSHAFRAIVAIGAEAEKIKGDSIELGEGILGSVALTKSGEIINNARTDRRALKIVATAQLSIEHMMAVPLLSGDRVTGIMAVWRIGEGLDFQAGDLDFLNGVSQQAAIAVENARLFEATRESQRTIERSESELRALFAAMNDVIIVYDKEGRYVRVAPTNPSRLFLPPDDLLGQKVVDVLPAHTAQSIMTAIERALATNETVKLEYTLEINQQEYWFEGNVSKLNEEQVFLVARDITERKHAEDLLQRRNEYLAAAAEIGRLVTSTLDLNTIFIRTVNLVRERFGYYHAAIFVVEETGSNAILREATGDAGAEMKRRQHSLPVNANSVVGKATQTGEVVVINNTTLNATHKPNPLLPATRAEAALPLRVGTRIIGALDIQSPTVDSFVPDDLAVLQILADQVAIAIDNARSYELSQQAIKEMREVDRMKSMFLANMSHELRTPLNSIIGFSRVILKGIDGPTSELQQQDLTAIYNSGQHLLGLINDILDLSKIEAGKMELAFDEVNLTDLINGVMSTVIGLVKDKPIKLVKNIQENLPTVRADAIRVRQVLLNLLSNASKFTSEGSITVDATVSAGPAGHPEILVSVTDTGPGIEPKDQVKLFQPFSQVDDSLTRRTGGTGLGLSISQQLIQMHGGRIGLHSAVGKGSTFYFTLPIYRSKEEASLSNNGKVILAIDDDPQVISLYERYLQPQGYQVVSLTNPHQAIERARQLKPYAITLDIMMPGYDGWSVLNDLKANGETRDIPVIICSIIEDQERGFSLGAADYLLKPILEDDLLNALDRLNSDGSIREVLVVDDNPSDLRLMDKILREQGRYKAVLAEGGQKGWEAILSHPPHAVILDLFMPEMDGFTILEKMRENPKLRDIPVVVVSGVDLSAEQQQQLKDFGQRLLSKGALNETDLLNTIEHALKRIEGKK